MIITNKVKKEITEFLEVYNVDVHFCYMSSANASIRMISIDQRATDKSLLWSMVLHELVHILCYDNDVYKNYHKPRRIMKYNGTMQWREDFRKIALKAERYVDSQAELIFEALFPDLKFYKAYARKDSGKFLKQYFGL